MLAVGAVSLLCVGSAIAGGRSHPTTITHDSHTSVGPDVYVDSGQVISTKRCTYLRVVAVKAHYPDGSQRLLDVDIGSVRGAWATRANFPGADSATAKVFKRRYRSHGRRHTCRPASIELL
jgi:hypothetical protein